MPLLRHHIFVCQNQRPDGHPRGCCAAKDAEAVRKRLKDLIAARSLKAVIRANQAGCLDQCALGVTLVVYPEQVWYGGVTTADVEEILDATLAGRVVERLRIPPDVVNTRAASGAG